MTEMTDIRDTKSDAGYGHTSVLLHEVVDGLDIHAGDIIVDGTLGSGGHSEEIAKRWGDKVTIIGLDMDEDALARSKERLAAYATSITYVQANFRTINEVLTKLEIGAANKILLDIGLSSNQLETSGRGFTFTKDEPLSMTFKKNPTEEDITAFNIVNEWAEESIADIIYGYGEERYARRIAKKIVETREQGAINTTSELEAIIRRATPAAYHRGKIHPATRTFQALRITVNDELRALEQGIHDGFDRLLPGGRMAVISFHSLEDRIVKRFFKQLVTDEKALAITKKPIIPGDDEVKVNRRARSSKLRIVQKI
jgi:16S rRNA (cytosine1402-N4)-methyltransferase